MERHGTDRPAARAGGAAVGAARDVSARHDAAEEQADGAPPREASVPPVPSTATAPPTSAASTASVASTTPVPPVPHEAVARVIGRAVELGDEHAAPVHSADLDEHALVDIGRDVGVSPDAVRAALAEYHAGMLPDADRQQSDRLVGPRLLVVERSVPGPLAHVGAMVDELLEQQVFECCRRAGNRSVWRPREDLLATFQRAARKFSRGRPLRHVTELTVGLTEVPAATETPVHVRVRMAAELRSLRQGYVVTTLTGTVAGGGGVATAVGASLFVDPLALLGLVPSAAVAAGAWFGPRAGYRHRLAEAELVIQGGLDELVLRLDG